jgi:hypothetical protein
MDYSVMELPNVYQETVFKTMTTLAKANRFVTPLVMKKKETVLLLRIPIVTIISFAMEKTFVMDKEHVCIQVRSTFRLYWRL